MKSILVYLFLALCFITHAQRFVKPNKQQSLDFKTIQQQFNEWIKNPENQKQKGWKYFKRFEQELQMHTNAQGEPADPRDYLYAAIEASEEKESANQSKQMVNPWYPIGANAIPNNLTGYMENGIGRINCIAFHPSIASTYFIGVAQGGLWKTSNNGASWTPLTDNLPITRISDIAIDPINPNTMYISVGDFEYIGFGLYLNGRKRNTHYGLGVYKTTDGGLTWSPTGLTYQLTDGDASLIREIIIHPSNTANLVAAGSSGLFRSTNAGVSWTQILDSLMWDLIVDPVNPNTLYAASGYVNNANDGYAAIYKSIDFGQTWSMLNTNIPARDTVQRIKMAIAPNDNNYIYALTVDTLGGLYGIYKTTDAGANWTLIQSGVNILEWDDGSGLGGQGTYDIGLAVNASDKNNVIVGGINVWESNDGALNFNPVSHWTLNYGPTLHGDIHFIEQQPLTGNFFVCSDGGVYRTTNIASISWSAANGGTPWPTLWSNISDGMQVTSFYRLCSSKNTTGKLIAGAQDNATFHFDGTNWSTQYGGDGMDNYLDPLDDNWIISSAQYGSFGQSNDGGLSYNYINPNVNGENAEWTSPIIADYNANGTLYAGFSNVSQSMDNGLTWQAISSFPITGFYDNEISALAVANSNSNVLFASKRVRYEYGISGSVHYTSNGGSSWNDVTLGLPDSLYYTSVEIAETNPTTIYVSMAQFSAGNKVFMSSNSGSSWTNISYNLPNVPVNCVKYIPGSGGDLIAACDIGVYVLKNATTTWNNISNGLPNVIVSDIEFNPAVNKVYLSTFGRGIWASDLDALVSVYQTVKAEDKSKLYPSVNQGTFTIELPESSNLTTSIDIYDVMGRKVYSSYLTEIKNTILLNLTDGKYYAKLKGEGINTVKTFIINH